ncbi:hypothetical protein A2774_02730 [Candidatus Roizmanbacteria bacterium RIFCSPHIGHO2_01_FULL_39_12c]|uniref:Glycosyltransferase RgtA/B/C/D-like domain-containing protein n=1 Tax=Candidatus Roizmanbacteria bacterium RIFCSPHIGHO2_01_FULL_39_12c TaxID=1802031 RepID=A0A1F7GAI3_9BACT|nr:MAG: hypothetical protein A2774_02730 [Candidatus Roizmanbacteria bacterium RIFCSPHIGHO2_01_FULL_39_12c]
MKFRQLLIMFLLFRLFDLAIIFLSRFFIPYLGFFPYKEIALEYNLPRILTALANFDGAHYLLIAEQGYYQYQQAFFPLYPLLIRLLSPVFPNNRLITALVISNLSFLFGLWLFRKYLLEIGNSKLDIWPLIFLMAFPTSFFFGAVYTEGLFFLLVAGTFYYLKKERSYVTAIFSFLASLTRIVGVFLVIPILITQISNLKSQNHNSKVKSFIEYLITPLAPVLGLTFYSLYLWKSTGDPLFFLHSQWAFGANRSSSIVLLPQVVYRYLHIFFTANWNFQYFIALFEFAIFAFVLSILILDLVKNLELKSVSDLSWERVGINLFSLSNLLLPTLTGTLSSIPRYALFSLSFFLFLSQLKNNLTKVVIVCIFTILHLILLGFFAQGYFIS